MSPDLFGEVISSYTRAQAIEDGVLIDLSALAPDVCRQHYKFPVACTAEVWGIIDRAVKNERYCNDLNGVVHDILWISRGPLARAAHAPVGGLATNDQRRRGHGCCAGDCRCRPVAPTA